MASQKRIQYTINDIGGEVVKDNETYLLKDNKTLNNLVVSSTLLNPFKQTTGHNHSGQEGVYIFVSGSGYMIIDDDSFTVTQIAVTGSSNNAVTANSTYNSG